MKKNYLTFLFLLISSPFYAQINCANALPISIDNQYEVTYLENSQIVEILCLNSGLNTIAPKASWYVFTPLISETIKITTDLPVNQNGDTRFHIYTGTCENLVCVGGNDDVQGSYGPYLSTLNFEVTANTTYFIAFDNKWSSLNFTFEITQGYIAPAPGEFNFTQQYITLGGQNFGVVDLNGDFLDDIVGVPNATNMTIMYQTSTPNTFTSESKNVPGVLYSPSWCLTAGDYDRNGFNDLLYGSTNGVSLLTANQSGSSYTSSLNKNGIFSQRSNFIDINNDGNLDIFVCHDIAPNVFFLNDQSNQLTFFQGGLGDASGGGNYGSIWVDYDNDGDMDLFIAKCRGGNIQLSKDELFRNDGNGIFVNVSMAANMDDASQAWSSAWGDFDNDGYMDAIIGANSFSTGGHKYRQNNGNGTFTDITNGSGWDNLNSGGQEYIAQDFNNDGWIDVMCSNGNIMINNGDRTFTNFTYPASDGAIGDLNNDGFLDILDENKILYNIPNQNNWFKLNLQGVTSNRNGIGARIEIYGDFGKQIRDVRSGDGFARMSSLNPHFGIGTSDAITSVVIKWPSGIVDTILNPTINSTLFVLENSTALSLDKNVSEIFNIYPNPVKNILNIELYNQSENYHTQIFDLQGKLVYDNSQFLSNINLNHLQKGLYILLLTDSKGNNTSSKFLKE